MQNFEPTGLDYKTFAEKIFQANFIKDIGIEMTGIGPGWCESRLDIQPRHLQQMGMLHAGVVATIADHTAGASASTVMKTLQMVLTVEFKLNLLRPGYGDSIRCRSEVLKAGKTITVSESEVFAANEGTEKLIAKATVTLAYREIGRTQGMNRGNPQDR